MLYNYIIYHKNSLDGFTSYVLFTKTKNIDKDPIVYPDTPYSIEVPSNLKGKNVIIIDVSYKIEILNKIVKLANNVLFIDHHITNIDEIQKLEKKNLKLKIIYDEKECASTLVWDTFFKKQKRPEFIKYIKDNDIGEWKYKNTIPFITALKIKYKTYPNKYKNWYDLLEKKNVNKLIKFGDIYNEYHKHIIDFHVKIHVMRDFPSTRLSSKYNLGLKEGQYKVCIANNNSLYKYDLMSELLNTVKCDFVILWYYIMDDNKYIFSLRSNDVDVGSIAKKFGGGGHKNVAAFSLNNINNINNLFVDILK